MLNTTFETLAVAMGCGLLIGTERERRNALRPRGQLAGIRTFALASLMGSLCATLAQPVLLAVAALLVAGLGIVAHARDQSDEAGVTTELALFFTFLLGVLSTHEATLAVTLAVVVTGLLASRESLHRFSRQWLTQAEIHDGLTLGALVLIALPLVPNEALWQGMVNPRQVLQLLILLLLIQGLAHLGRRLLQSQGAMALSALASGFVSSTATIAQWGLAVREGRETVPHATGAALLTCVATQLNLLVVAAAVQPDWVGHLLVPCLAGGAVVGVWGWRCAATHAPACTDEAATADPSPPDAQPMFRLREAAVIALALSLMQLGVKGMMMWLGDGGMLLASVIASVADLHSALAAVMLQGSPQHPIGDTVRFSLMLGLATHAVSRTTVAALSGGRAYAQAVAPAMFIHTAVVLVLLWWEGLGAV
jgi:uncharacterized membrane protein (DUF4010 family)